MRQFDVLRGFRTVSLATALAFVLTFAASATPPAAPPLTTDPVYPNLFYGAVPSGSANAPVVVFVHGMGGNVQDWIEIANCPSTIAGCVGSKNDMYDFAYQAGGMRTVFLSLNADNTNNNANIQTNSAMLQKLFPEILSYTGASKVYFVCHSKGGLDLEDALATPQWIGIAKAVITLGTPNQGDALSDYLFSPTGYNLYYDVIPQLFTPAVQSMEIANVQQFRSQWDPIFQNAGIPFYTLEGSTWACQAGTTTCPTIITGPILNSITGYKNAPPNDGLVTEPETQLPTSYGMELGVIAVNHYLLRMGDNSFSYIQARVLAIQNEQPGVTRVATGGFGDIHNTWAWSMAWFNNMLYVGTGRETYCVTSATSAIQLGISSLYPPALGDCTPDYHDLPLQAEIWQYNPATNVWTMVFQSPNSLSTVQNNGVVIGTARDIGFRGLTVVNEPGNVTALYAGGVTSGEMFECQPETTTPCTPQGSWPPPRILRTTDGVTWNPVPQNGTLTTVNGTSVWTPAQCGSSPCFLGSLTANGVYTTPAYPNYSIRSAAQMCSTPGSGCTQNGILFVQVGDFPGVGRAIATAPGVNPGLGDNCGQATCYQWASPATATLPMWILEYFNGYMYAGTGSPAITGTAQQYGLWNTNATGAAPYTWNSVIVNGAYAQNLIADYAMSLQVFSDPTYCPNAGCLYVGTDRPNEMVRIHPDGSGQAPGLDPSGDSWDLVIGNPRTIPAGEPGAGRLVAPVSGIGQYFDNGFTGHFWRMGVGSQGLYMGTWDWSSDNVATPTFGPLWSQEYGTDTWRTPDGVHWTFMSKIGFGDGNNTGSRSFAATPYGLYMGTARSVGGTQVFNVDNGTLDFNKDHVIDQKDVLLMQARVGTKAVAKDPMDLNQDGKITAADVKLMMTQCTYAGCASPAANPKGSVTLASPVVYSTPGPLGGSVSISWPAVSGAAQYLVYRIAMSPNETTPPPTSAIAKAVTACRQPGSPSICSMSPQTQAQQTTALYGYPSAPELMATTSALSYAETAPNTLQSLYFVVAEDSSGNLSSPSNVVGGPSLASQ